MKRLFVLVLALLVLAGCGKQIEETPETTVQQETQPDPGWYIPDSEMERASKGAIRVYNLPTDEVLWINNVGSELLLATADGLAVLTGENGIVSAPIVPEIKVTEDGAGFQFTSHGLAYYLKKSNEVVYLDQQLQVISRIALPEEPNGEPIITPDGSEIFYCIGNEIRAYDTTRNITRPVKKQLVQGQALTGYLFGGKVLSCSVMYESGEQGGVYLDSRTGETLSTDWQTKILDSNDNTYLAVSNDGLFRQEIFGSLTAEPAVMDIPDDMELIPAVELGGVVGVTAENGAPAKLSMYDFRTGKITSTVNLSGVDKIMSSCTDKWSRCIWLLVESKGSVLLYRWSLDKSKIEDSVSYKTPLYTPENPDTEGLSACEDRVAEMNKTYGVDIHLWLDAVTETGEYTVTPEHRPAAITAFLDELEKVFQLFPDKFLRRSATRPLHLCVVRSIDGGTQSVQFYKKSNAYIFLASGCDVQTELIRGLGYVVNSRVVSNSPLLDSWTSLNPDGFVYGQAQTEYLEGEGKAFADENAMTSVVEDRSSIFRYAMAEDNAEMFDSEIMQQKLLLLCKGIRKVWKWDKEEDSYPWEQYLDESLAYVKE